MSRMTILCVEDQSEYMATLTYMLEGIGYDEVPASNGIQAIDLLAKQTIDGVPAGIQPAGCCERRVAGTTQSDTSGCSGSFVRRNRQPDAMRDVAILGRLPAERGEGWERTRRFGSVRT